MNTIASRCRLLLAGFTAVAMLGLPATAGAVGPSSSAAGCPQVPVSQPFAPWGDMADYFLAPDGGFEGGADGWALGDGARVVRGSEPFAVVAPSDARSLRLAPGSSATTAPFCIGVEHRSLRFFTHAAQRGALSIDVLYADADGAPRETRIGSQSGDGSWAPSDIVPMVVNELAAEHGNALMVRLRFTADRASWAIDDVHIDPYRTR